MTIGNVDEQEYCFWLVMFMDRMYRFGDVNEEVYFSDVNKLGEWQSVVFGDANELAVFWWC